MLNVLYILEALRDNNIIPGLLSGWTRKDIEQLPNFFFRLRIEIINVLYILQALRHNNIMPGLLLGWTRKDIEQMHSFFFRLRIKMLTVLYILEAFRNSNMLPGLLPKRTRKDISFFFGYGSKCLLCYISQKRSGIITLFQDFYLREPKRI